MGPRGKRCPKGYAQVTDVADCTKEKTGLGNRTVGMRCLHKTSEVGNIYGHSIGCVVVDMSGNGTDWAFFYNSCKDYKRSNKVRLVCKKTGMLFPL